MIKPSQIFQPYQLNSIRCVDDHYSNNPNEQFIGKQVNNNDEEYQCCYCKLSSDSNSTFFAINNQFNSNNANTLLTNVICNECLLTQFISVLSKEILRPEQYQLNSQSANLNDHISYLLNCLPFILNLIKLFNQNKIKSIKDSEAILNSVKFQCLFNIQLNGILTELNLIKKEMNKSYITLSSQIALYQRLKTIANQQLTYSNHIEDQLNIAKTIRMILLEIDNSFGNAYEKEVNLNKAQLNIAFFQYLNQMGYNYQNQHSHNQNCIQPIQLSSMNQDLFNTQNSFIKESNPIKESISFNDNSSVINNNIQSHTNNKTKSLIQLPEVINTENNSNNSLNQNNKPQNLIINMFNEIARNESKKVHVKST